MAKFPPRVVPSDDLVVLYDGQEIRPHEGETVTFRGRASVADYLSGLKLQRLGTELVAEVNTSEIDALFAEALTGLASKIVEWTWTDDEGEPLPSPPTADLLQRLSFEELTWLVRAAGGQRSEGEKKDDS